MSVIFLNITKEEFLSKKLLLKYLPLEFAIATIKEKQLWLSNPTIWKDPFEKRFITGKYNAGIKKKDLEFPLNGRVFCSCFTETLTSEAHWINYPNGKVGVSFRIRRSVLLDLLKQHSAEYEIYIGRVNYLKTVEIRKKLSDIEKIKDLKPLTITNKEVQIQLMLLKRVSFSYENEIRIFAIKKNKTQEAGIPLTFNGVSAASLIDRITLDPSLGRHTEAMLKELFKKEYRINNVFKSQLYSMQKEAIIEI